MSLPRYPEYKDSGMRWLGSIPAHWNAGRLKEVIRSIESGVSVNATDVPAAEGAVGVLKTSCVYDGTFRFTENKAVVEEDLARVSCPVAEGTLIVSRMNTPALVGAAGLVTQSHPNIYLPDRLWQVSLSSGSSSFLHYWTLSGEYRAQVEVACSGTSSSMQNLGQDQFKNFQIALPAEEEQRAIATFLDRETAKIDALIAEQEKLLALLAEKRQATISHAVTRGLNPNAPMKDSGIPWLGEVPAHWEMRRLKTISPAITVGIVVNPSDYVSDTGLPFIYGGDIAEGRISTTSCRRIDPVDSDRQVKTRLNAGDLLTVRVGAPGVTAVVPEECEGGNCASVMLIRRGDFNSDWLCFAMNSRMVRYQVEVVQYGAAQEQFNIGHAIDFWVATPPRDEQDTLAAAIRNAIERIESLRAQAEQAIGLLRERRSALISAAVTGKIDVRKTVARESESGVTA